MSRSVALIGKQGPLFGDRPSATVIEFVTEPDSAITATVRNWAADDRTDAQRAAFDQAAAMVDLDQMFGGFDL